MTHKPPGAVALSLHAGTTRELRHEATLFYASQTAVEKAHIVGGFRFELSKLTVPAIRQLVIAPRIGALKRADGRALHAEGSLANSAAVQFDAVVLPAGEAGVVLLARHAKTQEFVTLQHRHGKTILALGSAQVLLDQAGIPTTLPSGDDDPGIVRAARRDLDSALAAFIAAVGKHRHPQRDPRERWCARSRRAR